MDEKHGKAGDGLATSKIGKTVYLLNFSSTCKPKGTRTTQKIRVKPKSI